MGLIMEKMKMDIERSPRDALALARQAERPRIEGIAEEALPDLSFWIASRECFGGDGRRMLADAIDAFEIFTSAKIPASWAETPDAIKHGIIRHAALAWNGDLPADPRQIPTACAALWRPWRVMRMEGAIS